MDKSLFYDEIMLYKESEIGREALNWACDFNDEVKSYEQWTPEFCKNMYDAIIFVGTAIYANAKVNGSMNEYETANAYFADKDNWSEIGSWIHLILSLYKDKFIAVFGDKFVNDVSSLLEDLEEDQDEDFEN